MSISEYLKTKLERMRNLASTATDQKTEDYFRAKAEAFADIKAFVDAMKEVEQ